LAALPPAAELDRLSIRVSGRRRKPRLSNNAKVLLLACCLFSCITVSQYIAALMAHSLALAADCASMFADALSFLGNLLAECAPAHRKVFLELVMSAVSLLLLGGFTLFFVLQALDNLDGDGSAGERAEVNAHIVIIFAVLGILFDVTSLAAFKIWHLDDARKNPEPAMLGGLGSPLTFSGDAVVAAAAMSSEADGAFGGESAGSGEEDEQRLAGVSGASGGSGWDQECVAAGGSSAGVARECGGRALSGSGEVGRGGAGAEWSDDTQGGHGGDETPSGHKTNVNMLSAGLHLVSDFARSLTTLVEGLVLLGGYGRSAGVSSAFIDGVAALVVCTLIATGFLAGCIQWTIEVLRRCRRRQGHGAARAGSRGRAGSAAAAGMMPAPAPEKCRTTSLGLRVSSSAMRHVRLEEGEAGSDGGDTEHVGAEGGGTGGTANGGMAAIDNRVDIEGGAPPNGSLHTHPNQCVGLLHTALQRDGSHQRHSGACSNGILTPTGRALDASSGSPFQWHRDARGSPGVGRKARPSPQSGFHSVRREDFSRDGDGVPLASQESEGLCGSAGRQLNGGPDGQSVEHGARGPHERGGAEPQRRQSQRSSAGSPRPPSTG
jgi:Co/Zn/Cd efflux system component